MITNFEETLISRVGSSTALTDGVTTNVRRTLPVDVFGESFTVILIDSAGVQDDVKVQANNSAYLDKAKPYHSNNRNISIAINTNIGNIQDNLGTGDEQREPSATAEDFANNWVDIPGGLIDQSASAYVGSGAWRMIRLISSGTAGLNATMKAYVWAKGYSTQ